MSWLNPNNELFWHKASVNSVQFNGLGNMAVSGSADKSIIRWNVAGFERWWVNQHDGKIAKNIGKSVRVVRYRPVNNDLVAAGLENGEIKLWDVLGDGKNTRTTFVVNQDDRVFDLKFSPDSRYLFSGHGSGSVMQWDVNQAIYNKSKTVVKNVPSKLVNFSIYSLALVGEDKQNLVIGGRYNNLVVWNWKQQKSFNMKYSQPGSQKDYIFSLAGAEYNSNRLATSDNQGRITLWNMEKCLNNNGECEIIDQWIDGHGGKAVRSVALTGDGCYLASGGDDGRVVLWSLTKEGRRFTSTGQQVYSALNMFNQTSSDQHGFNSVDVKVVNQRLLLIAGNQDKQVIYKNLPLDTKSNCSK
jgi:WD40 repeat protein